MHMKISAKIKELYKQRELLNLHPKHITLQSLINALPEISVDYIKEVIENYERAGYIQTGDTLNSRWIKIL